MAASLLEQFDKPWATERVRRLIDIPGSTPFRDPDELSAIAIPTLIIGAPQDPVHPLSIALQWAEWIPTAHYIQINARDADADQHRSDLRSAVDSFLADL